MIAWMVDGTARAAVTFFATKQLTQAMHGYKRANGEDAYLWDGSHADHDGWQAMFFDFETS